jgi:prophage regulatory protein
LLPLAEVMRRTCKSRTSIYAGIRSNPPKFPRPIKDGFSSRWLENEVDAWVAERIAARDETATPSA